MTKIRRGFATEQTLENLTLPWVVWVFCLIKGFTFSPILPPSAFLSSECICCSEMRIKLLWGAWAGAAAQICPQGTTPTPFCLVIKQIPHSGLQALCEPAEFSAAQGSKMGEAELEELQYLCWAGPGRGQRPPACVPPVQGAG